MPSPKMWHIYHQILLSHKKKEVLSFVTTKMDLEGITLSEIRENKYQYCIISLICEIPLQTKKKKKEKETEAIERID